MHSVADYQDSVTALCGTALLELQVCAQLVTVHYVVHVCNCRHCDFGSC